MHHYGFSQGSRPASRPGPSFDTPPSRAAQGEERSMGRKKNLLIPSGRVAPYRGTPRRCARRYFFLEPLMPRTIWPVNFFPALVASHWSFP